MKGTIIENIDDHKEETKLGIGLECPECGLDMRKVLKTKIKAKFNQKNEEMETTCGDVSIIYQCICGYQEKVIRPEEV